MRPVYYALVLLPTALALYGEPARGQSSAPAVAIVTEAPGYAAAEVERRVTFPLEAALDGLPEVVRVRSGSSFGRSIVWVEGRPTADHSKLRKVIIARLRAVKLPEGMTPALRAGSGDVLLLAVLPAVEPRSDAERTAAALRLRALAEGELRTRLMRVAGIAKVSAGGGLLTRLEVAIDRAKLTACGLSVHDVLHALKDQNIAASAGPIGPIGAEYAPGITVDPGERSLDADNLALVVLRRSAKQGVIFLRDVALVRRATTEAGPPLAAAYLAIYAGPDADLRKLRAALNEALRDRKMPRVKARLDGDLTKAPPALLAAAVARLSQELSPELVLRARTTEGIGTVLTPTRPGVIVALSGPDPEVLHQAADELAAALTKRADLAGVRVAPQRKRVPSLSVTIDRDRAAKAGVKMSDITSLLQAYLGETALLSAGNVTVRAGRAPLKPQDVATLAVRGGAGRMIPLGQLATIRKQTSSVGTIYRSVGRRQVLVLAETQGRPRAEVLAEVRHALAPVERALRARGASYRAAIVE